MYIQTIQLVMYIVYVYRINFTCTSENCNMYPPVYYIFIFSIVDEKIFYIYFLLNIYKIFFDDISSTYGFVGFVMK